MKSFKQHIYEKLKVSARNITKHTLFPKTKDELFQMINDEIYKNVFSSFNLAKNISIINFNN